MSNSSSNEQLLRCPFCGHSARLARDDNNRWQQVVCGGCGAKGPERMQKGADDAWNRRSSAVETSDRQHVVDHAGDCEPYCWCHMRPTVTADLNSCRARLHDISNGPLYELQMSARREVGLAIDEARTAIARACHDLRRATTVAESSVETAARPVDKTTERLCIRPNGRHSMALDVDGKPYCTWCDWPVNDVVPAVDPSPLQSDADHLMQALVKQEGVLNACEALLREAINDEGVNAGFDERLAAYWKRSAALASSPEEPGICIHSLKGHAGDKCPECGDGPCPHVNGIARA